MLASLEFEPIAPQHAGHAKDAEHSDAGPIVIQGRLAVRPGEDEGSLSARVQRLEHIIYPRAVGWMAEGRLAWRDGAAYMDGAPLQPAIVEEEA